MKTLYTFLNAHFMLRFVIAAICTCPLVIASLWIAQLENVFLLAFYVFTMYCFAYLSDILTEYRALLAVAPIAQRTFLQHIFLYYFIVSSVTFALFSVIALFTQLEHLLIHCALLLAMQLALVFFTPTVPYVMVSLLIVTVLFIVDLSTIVLQPVLLLAVAIIIVTSFFLLNRSTKWRFTS